MKNKILKALAVLILAATVISFVPVITLYLAPKAAPVTNAEAIERLKANAGPYFEFIVTGDIHAGLFFDDSAAMKMIRHMNREDRFKKAPIDLVIVCGDNAFRGSEWDFGAFDKLKALIKYPVISAIGNHDDDDDKGKTTAYFKKHIGEKEFSFTDRNSYFIVVDDADTQFNEARFNRLEEELKKSERYEHRFVIGHKAPLSPYQQSWYRPELGDWSYRFMKLCEKYKVDMAFFGHEHMFKEMNHGGVKYVITGGGGMITQTPSYDGGYLHYTVVRVYHDYIDYETRRIFPPLWEYLFYYLWKDIFYAVRNAVF